MKSYLNEPRNEIEARAAQLLENTLRGFHGPIAEITASRLGINPNNKGKLGNLVEVLHFGLTLNSRSGPDFIKAGIELKTTGVKELQSGEIVAKERLPLGMIDFMRYKNPSDCLFDTGGILQKCQILLLMVYRFEEDAEIIDLVFKLAECWEFPTADLKIIRQDWELIVQKIRDGKAHELSEGDTFYLAASTAGGGHGQTREQPFSDEPAKPRKFSLKQAYVDHILAVLSGESKKKYGRIIADSKVLRKKRTLEQIIIEKFRQFKGLSYEDILKKLQVRGNIDAKHFAALLTKAVFNIELGREIEEFEKAGIISRTVRLELTGRPEQSVSFPAFEYRRIVKEAWEESDFKRYVESKFFFVFFQYSAPKNHPERRLIFKGACFWNMPEADIEEAKKVWQKTIQIVAEGDLVRGYTTDRSGKRSRQTNFPGQSQNRVAHVRPHASTVNITFPLPVTDKLTGATEYTQYSFWLNNNYVRDSIVSVLNSC
jgi:DNA mismatch repair protein MutH